MQAVLEPLRSSKLVPDLTAQHWTALIANEVSRYHWQSSLPVNGTKLFRLFSNLYHCLSLSLSLSIYPSLSLSLSLSSSFVPFFRWCLTPVLSKQKQNNLIATAETSLSKEDETYHRVLVTLCQLVDKEKCQTVVPSWHLIF